MHVVALYLSIVMKQQLFNYKNIISSTYISERHYLTSFEEQLKIYQFNSRRNLE
jgi:hypothetical protein